jgi:pyrroline-5-carboxylate reductase
MKGISTQQIKTALIRIDNALSEIETGAITLSESDATTTEQREDARAILKALRHAENCIEDIRLISTNL